MTENRHDDDQTQISRRRFVGGTLVAGAGAAVAGVGGVDPAEAARSKLKHKHKKPASGTHTADVVVIGAGLSGLTSARAVKAAGRSVVVLEARSRVGGRCFSRPLGVPGATDVANMGATFVGPTQTQILGLMSELGIGTFPVYADGRLLYYKNGRLSRYTGTIPPSSDPTAVIELGTLTPAGD